MKVLTAVCACVFLGSPAPVRGEPTPSVGRGYTPAISSMHTICFDKLPVTPASYDFDYVFEELDTTSRERRTRHQALRGHEVDAFIRDQTHETTVSEGTVTQHVHYLIAVLVVESYYASIDEAHAELSAQALELLKRGDVHAFFTSCGTHYLRSLSRRAFFLTMFSYTSSSATRDRAFERQIEQQVRRFHGAAGPTAEDQTHERKFADQARSKSLKVVTRSVGLPARSTADMLPFDLATYKRAVKDAFKATQEPGAGRVVAMEVLPWLSNTLVLTTVDLDLQRRRILADNAEFYIELAAALQEVTTQVHRAEACRRKLDQEAIPAGAQVVSHRTGARLPVQTLVDAVSNTSIDQMRATGLRWRDGADGKSGVTACLDELERTGLSGRYHNAIPACEWERIKLPNAATIDEYCPPDFEH